MQSKQSLNRFTTETDSARKNQDRALTNAVQQFNDVFLEDFEDGGNGVDCRGAIEAPLDKDSAEQVPNCRALARRLLKSPEPTLPNYFTSVNAETGADAVEPEPLFDSRPPSAALSQANSGIPAPRASPFKQFSREAQGLKKQRGVVSDVANPIVHLEVSKDIGDQDLKCRLEHTTQKTVMDDRLELPAG